MSDSKAIGSFLVAEFEQEIGTTTKVIAAVPDSGLSEVGVLTPPTVAEATSASPPERVAGAVAAARSVA